MLQCFFDVDLFVYIGMISLLDLWLLFQHSIDVDLFHLGWVKCTIGKPQSSSETNHHQSNIKTQSGLILSNL